MADVARRPRRDTTPRRRRRSLTVDAFTGMVTDWWANKRLFDQSKKLLEGDKKTQLEGLRPRVLEEVKRIGSPDERGSRFHYFPAPIDGLVGLKAQRSTSSTFDSEAAQEILTGLGPDVVDACTVTVLELVPDKQHLVLEALKSAGLVDECVQNVTEEIDQDKVYAFHALNRDRLTDEHLERMTPIRESWSLIPLEAET